MVRSTAHPCSSENVASKTPSAELGKVISVSKSPLPAGTSIFLVKAGALQDSANTATLMCWTAAPFPAVTRRRNGSPFLNARQSPTGSILTMPVRSLAFLNCILLIQGMPMGSGLLILNTCLPAVIWTLNIFSKLPNGFHTPLAAVLRRMVRPSSMTSKTPPPPCTQNARHASSLASNA